MKFLLKLFPPQIEYLNYVSILLAQNQYEQCVVYLSKANKKQLAREIEYYIVKSEALVDVHMMNKYKIMCELYSLVFKKASKYANRELYHKCNEVAAEDDKPLNFYIHKLIDTGLCS